MDGRGDTIGAGRLLKGRIAVRGAKAIAPLLCVLAVVSCEETGSRLGEIDRPIELVAAAGPGGGLDLVARAMDRVSRELNAGVTFAVSNRDGGGGNVARAYLARRAGDSGVLLCESNRVWLNQLTGTTQYGVEQTTPLARLTTEYLVWAVRADSRFESAIAVLDALRRAPSGATFGVGTIPSNDYFNVVRPIQAAGIDRSGLRIVAFRSGGDLLINLLGGHVDVISTGLSEVEPHVEAGTVRVLAVSSPVRLIGSRRSEIPTWRELGMDVTIHHWRGIFGPPAMPVPAVEYWDAYFSELVQTDAWKAMVKQLGQEEAYLGSRPFLDALRQEREANRPFVNVF